MRANLEEVMTDTAYAHMLSLAARLAEGFRRIIHKYGLAWSVTELGARSEFQFCPQPHATARPPRRRSTTACRWPCTCI